MTRLWRCWQCGKNMTNHTDVGDICTDCVKQNIEASKIEKTFAMQNVLSLLEKARLEDALDKAKEEKSQWVANAYKSERELQAVIDSLQKKLKRAEKHKKIQLTVIRGRKDQNRRLNKALDRAENQLRFLRIMLRDPNAYKMALAHWHRTRPVEDDEKRSLSVTEVLFAWVLENVDPYMTRPVSFPEDLRDRMLSLAGDSEVDLDAPIKGDVDI